MSIRLVGSSSSPIASSHLRAKDENKSTHQKSSTGVPTLGHASSHQELTVSDLAAVGRVRSPSPISRTRSDDNSTLDPDEIEVKGKELATQAWNEDEGFLAKEKIAEWLGGV